MPSGDFPGEMIYRTSATRLRENPKMGMTVFAVIALLGGTNLSAEALNETPNCEDNDPGTPCCPLDDRSNIGVLDAWLDCVGMIQKGTEELRSA